MSKGQIIEVDPSTLTIALNVRRDVKLDKDFLASIKQHGVLQPPMVVKTEAGYEVVIGQRRALAAAQAKLPKIEAYLVDRTEADAARIVDQLTENEQRQQLSDVERVGGYKELALIGISPADIAKRTSTPKDRVERGLAVAESAVATKALGDFQITLDQAAEIVEFEGDKAAVKRLTETAESNPGQFAHVVKDLREKRLLAEQKAAVQAEVKAAGAEALKPVEWANDRVYGWTRLDQLGTIKDPSVVLDRKAVKADQLGGRAVKSWKDGGYLYEVQWFVRDGHEFPAHARTVEERERTPEDIEREKRWAAEDKARKEAQAARQAAREVRTAWIRDDLLQRKTLDVVPFVAMALTSISAGCYYGEVDELALTLLGIEVGDEVAVEADDEIPAIAALQKRIVLGQPWQVLLAMVLSAIESDYGAHGDPAAAYLEQLVSWGYGLSKLEQGIVDAAKKGKKAA